MRSGVLGSMIGEAINLISAAGGGIFGAIQGHVRLLALQKHELNMRREKLEYNNQQASRKMQGWFTNVLRLLFLLFAWCLLASLLILPPLLHIPLYVEMKTTVGWFSRLFGAHPKTILVAVSGFYFSPFICMAVGYVATFLFGTARVKR